MSKVKSLHLPLEGKVPPKGAEEVFPLASSFVSR